MPMKRILQWLSSCVSRMPLARALALGRWLGWVYGSVIRYHRRDAFDALARSLPEIPRDERAAIVDRMYANLGMNLVELLRLGSAPDEYLRDFLSVEGEEHVRAALAQGKGVIALTGHIGNWDLLCTLSPRFGYPLTIITKEIKPPELNEYWMETRRRFGLKFVPAHNSYRKCLSALKKNELVGFILDQNMIRTEGVFVDFFGRPACTTPGLAYMAAQSGAPVLPVFAVREADGHHRIRILPALESPPDREPETIRRFTQLYTRVIEQAVQEHPDQWIWIHRRWRTVQMPGQESAGPAPDA